MSAIGATARFMFPNPLATSTYNGCLGTFCRRVVVISFRFKWSRSIVVENVVPHWISHAPAIGNSINSVVRWRSEATSACLKISIITDRSNPLSFCHNLPALDKSIDPSTHGPDPVRQGGRYPTTIFRRLRYKSQTSEKLIKSNRSINSHFLPTQNSFDCHTLALKVPLRCQILSVS